MSDAFLSAELSEDVTILTQPAPELIQFGLVKPGTLYQCTKACYDLREAPKLWEESRDKTLTAFTFTFLKFRPRETNFEKVLRGLEDLL